jgi:oxygen-independent coproporphyrinogen-3 oxidase
MSSLYVHIPYCERKCIYCDFYSIENTGSVETYLSALDAEIAVREAQAREVTFETVYFGGGTPSLLTPSQIQRIMNSLRSAFEILSGAEVTLEVNPGTVTADTLSGFRQTGINRLSIGIQSFRDEELRFLGRIHDSRQASQCIDAAREAGFQNISIDLIYSLPGQTTAEWDFSLRRGLAAQPVHISAYSLIVEDHTPLARLVASRQVSPNPLESEAALFEHTMAVLEQEGFEHYEVSNYARPGYQSRHNTAYWTHTNYLGFGPSAHSFWRRAGWDRADRWSNVANVRAYCDALRQGKLPVNFHEEVSRDSLMNERLFLGLRSGGVDLERIHRDFGKRFPQSTHDIIGQLVSEGKATLRRGVLRLTIQGFPLCDEIAARMMV